jgi:hypothetical protein
MYWVQSYFLKQNKGPEFQKWLQSEEAKSLHAAVERETGLRYMGTFWAILGFGKYDCEDWFEAPNWATLDKIRDSEAMGKIYQRFFELDVVDFSRPSETRMLRSTSDVLVFEPDK